MRTINVVVEDEDFEKLMKVKRDMGWKDFIMLLASIKVKKNGDRIER